MRKALFSLLAACCITAANAQPDFKITDTFRIAGGGGWDYIAVQPNSNRLFVSHGSQVNVLNKFTGDSIGIIANTIGVHGIAFIPALNKGYTSNGRLNNIFVFDLSSLAVVDSIKTGLNPDAIFYDPYSQRIITCNGRSNDVTFIDPVKGGVTGTVNVGGKPETAVSNGKGWVFVNVEDKNEVAVIDTKSLKVVARWSLLPGEAPTGLAIDTITQRLFVACGDNNFLVVLNAETGKVVSTLPIGAGCDGAGFDPVLKNIYTSNGAGTLTVIHEQLKDIFKVTANVPTKKSARTMVVDEETHAIYLPAAELEATKGREWPKIIPGTFKVLVLKDR